MPDEPSVPADQLTPGQVRRAGEWAVGNSDGELFAVSRRCRHQLGDLSEGSIDADGCLVSPGIRRATTCAAAKTPRDPAGSSATTARNAVNTQLVLAYSKVLRLRVARAARRGRSVVERSARLSRRPPRERGRARRSTGLPWWCRALWSASNCLQALGLRDLHGRNARPSARPDQSS